MISDSMIWQHLGTIDNIKHIFPCSFLLSLICRLPQWMKLLHTPFQIVCGFGFSRFINISIMHLDIHYRPVPENSAKKINSKLHSANSAPLQQFGESCLGKLHYTNPTGPPPSTPTTQSASSGPAWPIYPVQQRKLILHYQPYPVLLLCLPLKT